MLLISTFDCFNGAYFNFFQKIMTVIDKIATNRNKQVKGNTQIGIHSMPGWTATERHGGTKKEAQNN